MKTGSLRPPSEKENNGDQSKPPRLLKTENV